MIKISFLLALFKSGTVIFLTSFGNHDVKFCHYCAACCTFDPIESHTHDPNRLQVIFRQP